jgi:hypothetical protein
VTTRLGQLQSKPAVPATPTSKLGKFVAAGLRGEMVELPVLGPAYVELPGHDTTNQIESETIAEMRRLDLEASVLTALTYDAEKARRTLAHSVRDAEDRSKPFGTVDEWGKVDPDIISACYQSYADVRYRLAPLDMPLTEEDVREIESAIEKKRPQLLRSFGVAALSTYLLTRASPPASSPTLPSSSGQSSPDA